VTTTHHSSDRPAVPRRERRRGRSPVKIDPAIAAETRDAVAFLATLGISDTTRAIAERGVRAELDRLKNRYNRGAAFPALHRPPAGAAVPRQPWTVQRCWYCGDQEPEAWEHDHQLPVPRGGTADDQVLSCRRCNRTKGGLDVEEFRAMLAEVLGSPIVFAGEVGPGEPFSADVAAARELMAAQVVTKLTGHAARRARAACWTLRLQMAALVETAVTAYVHELARRHNGGADFAPPPMPQVGQLCLFPPSSHAQPSDPSTG
jgi:hypothetical protein